MRIAGVPLGFATPLHASARQAISLVLYVHGGAPSASRAQRNLRRAIGRIANIDLEVRDIAARPLGRDDDPVVITPTLVRRAPLPRRVVTGELEDVSKIRELLVAATIGVDASPAADAS